MEYNFILNTDSYKASHFCQYPPDTEHLSCYVESRGGIYEKMCFFGLQMFLKEYLSKPISQDNIEQAEQFFIPHGLPFNRQGWQHILDKHGGYLPLEIEAVAEGCILPLRNVVTQVVNTDPKCYWLTSYIETSLLRAIWYPTTVATRSWYCKQVIKHFLEQTADDDSGLLYQMHDFGARGASSSETAALGGAAHLVNFKGTDTVYGVLAAKAYYQEPMAGYSIPAAEHSTIIAWGKEAEEDAFDNMIEQFAGDNKVVAVVSDSYNVFDAVEKLWGDKLKHKVINCGGRIVIRPDSGNPVEVVSKTLDILMDKFGYTVNSKGYRVLPNYIRLIQGDGITPDMIKAILAELQANQVSAENVAFGIGAELLQKLNRDTLEFAMKASAIKQTDKPWRDIYKDPITGHEKRSKRGRLALIRDEQGYHTIHVDDLRGRENYLQPVFRQGELLKEWRFEGIRQRAEQY